MKEIDKKRGKFKILKYFFQIQIIHTTRKLTKFMQKIEILFLVLASRFKRTCLMFVSLD